MMVTHHPKDGDPPTAGWSPTILRMVTTVPRTVSHLIQDSLPDMEFDSRAGQLVYIRIFSCRMYYPLIENNFRLFYSNSCSQLSITENVLCRTVNKFLGWSLFQLHEFFLPGISKKTVARESYVFGQNIGFKIKVPKKQNNFCQPCTDLTQVS